MTIQTMNLKISDKLASQLRELNRYIESSRGVIISGHVNPDGDDVGSQLALGEYLNALGKKFILLDEDSLPAHFRFLPNSEWFTPMAQPEFDSSEYDLLIVVDSGDLDRIGKVKSVLHPEMKIVNIDHHLGNSLFGHLNIIAENASSIGEILFLFFKLNEFAINKNIAWDLYISIATDTGFFRYDQTNPETHLIASELVRMGVDPNYFHIRLNLMRPLSFTKMLAEMLSRMELFDNNRIAYSYIEYGDFQKYSDLDTDGMIEQLGILDTVSVYFLIKEKNKDRFGVSLRSKQEIDVAKIASKFGGGGHTHAAGCKTDRLTRDEFRNQLIESIRQEMPSL